MTNFQKTQYFTVLSYGKVIPKWVSDVAKKELNEFLSTMAHGHRFYADNIFTEKTMDNRVFAKFSPYWLSDQVRTGKEPLEFTKGTKGPTKAYRLKDDYDPDKK